MRKRTCTYGVLGGSRTGKLRGGRIFIELTFSQKMRKKQYIVVEHVPIVFLEVVGLANSGGGRILIELKFSRK